MNVLDENIVESQRQLLRRWRLRVRQVGRDIGRQGMKDPEIIPLLNQLGGAAFFTCDFDFYRRDLCHASYCLVCLAVGRTEVARFVRRFLHHPAFNTRAKRLGKVILVSDRGIRVWRLHTELEQAVGWTL